MLKDIPNVHECINGLIASGAVDDVPLSRLKLCTRNYLDTLRQTILAGEPLAFSLADRQIVLQHLIKFVRQYHRPCLRRVINASGVIIHTNLGRSLLPTASRQVLLDASSHPSNLELNLESGKRGSRYQHVDALLCELTGAEAALVVNNNAAAVLLALDTLAKGKEAIVSRGQLVEIGGSFRIPDIMARSGARLVEVGCTNRTHLADYQQAIGPETALLLRVHCSNYRIIGFTGEVSSTDLAALGRERGIPTMEDLGSGCLVDLSRFGLVKEPTVQETVASGMDIVSFSGDKLLGGPQAGILLGKKSWIDVIKANPLNRALRIDKLTLAALELVLRLYLDESLALREIPTLAMIAASKEVIRARATRLLAACEQQLSADCACELVRCQSQVGGGAMPGQSLDSWAVALRPSLLKISQVEHRLRQAELPVIARIEEDRLLFDLRTVADEELELLLAGIRFGLARAE